MGELRRKERAQILGYQIALARACLEWIEGVGAMDNADASRHAASYYAGHLGAVQVMNAQGALAGKLARTMELMARNDGIGVVRRIAQGNDVELAT